ncbi:unnamed protein product [Diabrotica balteata]|uniref:Carboxylesterase type B domain-containing protein n=1 Tax=Diabrotica balteata TaxID=107213 RepID=A0A9N9XFS1_DIABA|nr:unnamed protein product [Diabrotica balteata]
MSKYSKNKPLSEKDLYGLIEAGLSDEEEFCDEETDEILTFEDLQRDEGIIVYYVNGDEPLVKTPQGTVQGYYKNSFGERQFLAFEGIPYAKPPVGNLRFAVSVIVKSNYPGRISIKWFRVILKSSINN